MTGRLRLNDKIKILETESLNPPRVTSDISTDTLITLSFRLHDLWERSARNAVTLQDVRAVLSHFGHPVRYDRETLEKSLDGSVLLYKRAFNPVVIITPRSIFDTPNENSPTLTDFLYLLQPHDDGVLYVGLHTMFNHTVKTHFVDQRLLRIEYKKHEGVGHSDLGQFGPRTVNDGRRVNYRFSPEPRYNRRKL